MRKLSDAARVLKFVESAPVDVVKLVLDLAVAKLDERQARSESFADRARKRFAKPVVRRKRRTKAEMAEAVEAAPV